MTLSTILNYDALPDWPLWAVIGVCAVWRVQRWCRDRLAEAAGR